MPLGLKPPNRKAANSRRRREVDTVVARLEHGRRELDLELMPLALRRLAVH